LDRLALAIAKNFEIILCQPGNVLAGPIRHGYVHLNQFHVDFNGEIFGLALRLLRLRKAQTGNDDPGRQATKHRLIVSGRHGLAPACFAIPEIA
jgi:hypothetical protein